MAVEINQQGDNKGWLCNRENQERMVAGTDGSELREKGDYALSKGIALFITEWGTSKADGGRDGTIYPEETEEWINWALERNISMANWSLADLRESSAALIPGASTSGRWDPETDLSPSGKLVRNKIIEINSKKPFFRE